MKPNRGAWVVIYGKEDYARADSFPKVECRGRRVGLSESRRTGTLPQRKDLVTSTMKVSRYFVQGSCTTPSWSNNKQTRAWSQIAWKGTRQVSSRHLCIEYMRRVHTSPLLMGTSNPSRTMSLLIVGCHRTLQCLRTDEDIPVPRWWWGKNGQRFDKEPILRVLWIVSSRDFGASERTVVRQEQRGILDIQDMLKMIWISRTSNVCLGGGSGTCVGLWDFQPQSALDWAKDCYVKTTDTLSQLRWF